MASGLTAGDLAYEGARRVLDEHEGMVLMGDDTSTLLDASIEPPVPNDKLVATLRHQAKVSSVRLPDLPVAQAP